MKPLLGDEDWKMRWTAASAVGSIFRESCNREVAEALSPLIKDRHRRVRWAVAKAFASLFHGSGSFEALKYLEPLMGDDELARA